MREILFRGKRTDNGKWVKGLLTVMWGQYHIINPNDENTAYPIDIETVGQYTGLTDNNGKKIFEGDIVKFTDDDGDYSNYEVYFDNNLVAFMTKELPCGGIDDMSEWGKWRKRYKIIGNIHDNPELLEVSE